MKKNTLKLGMFYVSGFGTFFFGFLKTIEVFDGVWNHTYIPILILLLLLIFILTINSLQKIKTHKGE